MRRLTMAMAGVAALVGAGAVVAADRDDDATRLAKALADYAPTGETSSCVPTLARTLDTKVYGKTILYRARAGGSYYRTETAGGCEGAERGDALVSVQYQNRPCQGDIVQTVDTVARFPTGSCSLGQFTTYKKMEPAK